MITSSVMAHLQLRQVREGKGVTLRQLAKASGVGIATLCRLEAGSWDPRLSTLEKLANVLGVTVAQLIGETSRKKGG